MYQKCKSTQGTMIIDLRDLKIMTGSKPVYCSLCRHAVHLILETHTPLDPGPAGTARGRLLLIAWVSS